MQKLTQADIIRKWFEIVNQPDVQAEDVKTAVRLARWVEAQYIADLPPKRGAKLLDEILVLFEIYQSEYAIVKEALLYIAEIRNLHPEHPITVSLAQYMREQGLIE